MMAAASGSCLPMSCVVCFCTTTVEADSESPAKDSQNPIGKK